MLKQYFPKGIAKGEAFFNRSEELKRLKNNVNHGTHTVLMSPRRYGKSSLAKFAIRETGLAYAEVDLFVAINDQDIGEKILAGVSHLIQQISGDSEKWFSLLKKFFAQYDKQWTIGFSGTNLTLIPNNPKTVPQNILDALNALEFILKKKANKAIIYLDEFQEILTTPTGKAIEGAIRHFAQECEQTVFIFSGSNRKMLKKIFDDRSQPLYSLCDEIRLDRIDSCHYEKYLKKVSHQTFGQSLNDETISEILKLSERHPRYVYMLCTEIWLKYENKLPDVNAVNTAWRDYVIQKQKDVRAELTNRTPTQIALLYEIATGNNCRLSGKENLLALQLTSSSVTQSLKTLEELDYIEQLATNEYRLIDPLIKSVLLYAKYN